MPKHAFTKRKRHFSAAFGNGPALGQGGNVIASRGDFDEPVENEVGEPLSRSFVYRVGIEAVETAGLTVDELAGFDGMLNFAREVYSSVMSPVWQFTKPIEGEES